VVPLGALGVLPVRVGLAFRFRQRRALFFQGGRGRGIGQAGAVSGNALPGGLGEVLPPVEPVGDLDRLRRAGAGSVRERARPVTADHLDAGVRG